MTLPFNEDDVLLLHNPRCSKSRAVLGLLEQAGIAFHERAYLEDPLTREELGDLARRLGRPLSEWIRTGEAAFREAGLGGDLMDETLIAAMAEAPILMERPIVIRGDHARVGRPPAAVMELFGATGRT